MSIERCISALKAILDEVRWTNKTGTTPAQNEERIQNFVRELALNIDLRHNNGHVAMSEIESELYLPTISRLQELTSRGEWSVNPRSRDEAELLVKAALDHAEARRPAGWGQ